MIKDETIRRNISKMEQNGFSTETIRRKLNEKYSDNGKFISIGSTIYVEDTSKIRFIKELKNA